MRHVTGARSYRRALEVPIVSPDDQGCDSLLAPGCGHQNLDAVTTQAAALVSAGGVAAFAMHPSPKASAHGDMRARMRSVLCISECAARAWLHIFPYAVLCVSQVYLVFGMCLNLNTRIGERGTGEHASASGARGRAGAPER